MNIFEMFEANKKSSVAEAWSQKYKSSINCSHPKGFSQKAHCAGKKKHNESIEMEMVCEDCGMCEAHGNITEIKKGQKDANGVTKCWPGKHAEGTKKGRNGGQVRNCVPNEGVAEAKHQPRWEVEQRTAGHHNAFYIVRGHSKPREVWKDSRGMSDFRSRAAAEAKAAELNSQEMTEDAFQTQQLIQRHADNLGTSAPTPMGGYLEENDTIKLTPPDTKVTDFIEAVYTKYPQTFQNNHVMPMGGTGDDQQFAMFELVPSLSRRGAVEVKWIQSYPLRQGVGSRAMQELQAMAKDFGIALTLFPWDKGQVSQAKLTKFYKSQGFKPTIKGAKNMAWTPESLDDRLKPVQGVAEGKGLAKKVKIVQGPDAGKTGWIREIKHGAFKDAPKSYYIDLDDGGQANNIPGTALRLVKDQGVAEDAEQLNVGDDVIISGDVQFRGATGVIDSFGRDNRFVVVNLYNHGRHSFHSSDVSYNDYADSDDEQARMYDAGEFRGHTDDDIMESRLQEMRAAGYDIPGTKEKLGIKSKVILKQENQGHQWLLKQLKK